MASEFLVFLHQGEVAAFHVFQQVFVRVDAPQ